MLGDMAETAISLPASPATADRASRDAALTLGLGLPGDPVLYLLLPLYAAEFGVSLPEAGVLLAANRLVRIAGYGWVARGYERFGPRAACIASAPRQRRWGIPPCPGWRCCSSRGCYG